MKQKLYVKNEKGRYEEYIPPVIEDKNLYRHLNNGKYEAIGTFHPWDDHLTEGIWVVTKHPSSRGETDGHFMLEQYGVEKISDLQPIVFNFAQLGTMNKVLEEVVHQWNSTHTSYNAHYDLKSIIIEAIKALQKCSGKENTSTSHLKI